MNTLRSLLDIVWYSHRERACRKRGFHRGTPMVDPISCEDCGCMDPASRVPLLGPNGLP